MELKLKKEKLNKIITIILVGLLLLIIVMPMGNVDEKDKETSSDYKEEEKMVDSKSAYYEERLKAILEKSYGPGTMEVMVHMSESEKSSGMYQESTMEVDGILIVADVDEMAYVGDISFAVCALFDLPAHKVAVIKK